MAERAEALCTDLGLEDPIRIAALDLLAKWRNVVARGSDRGDTPDSGPAADADGRGR